MLGSSAGLHERDLCNAAPGNYLHVCVWTFQVDFWVIVPTDWPGLQVTPPVAWAQAWLRYHSTFLLSSDEASASFTIQCSRGPGHSLQVLGQ